MEIHLTPETEKKLKDLARQSGRATDELAEDAMGSYVDEYSRSGRRLTAAMMT